LVEAGLVSFRAPEVLWLLVVLPFAAIFLIARERLRRAASNRFVSESLRGRVNPLRALRPYLLAGALLAAIIALAGPRYGTETVPVTGGGANRIVVIDLSNSMLATDVGTSRLDAAKAIARRVIQAHSGRTALIVFEGSPQVVSPLTTDADAVITLLESLEAGETREAGSNIESALRAAFELVGAQAAEATEIVLMSDGEEQGGNSVAAAAAAKEKGIIISAVTIGTPDGALIPLSDRVGYLQDDEGREVTTRANSETLAKIARTSGGRHFANPFASDLVRQLAEGSPRRGGAKDEVNVPVERFQWPLWTSLAFLFLGSVLHRGAE
jgi:Ca-activated chloride channel family protein